MKKLFVLLFFVLLSVPCFSQEVYQYGITAEIFENNTVAYKLNLIFVDNPDQTFILSLGPSSDVTIETKADCTVEAGVLETSVFCSMEASDRTNIVISYYSDQKVMIKDGYYLFTDSFRINEDAELVPILIKLPEGTGLREPIENSYSPENALIGSDGRRTIINWEMEDLKKGDRIDTYVAYERIGEVIISQIPSQMLFIILFVIVVVAFTIYKFYWKAKRIKMFIPILKSDEKKIYDAVTRNGSGVNQKIIVKESGYSKAKVSKVLKSLEEK